MADSGSRPQLHVEGTNDRHTICHVLIRRGIDYDQEPWPESFPVIKEIGNRDELIEGVDVAVSLSNHKSIGFVLDANSSVQDRWKAISSRLSKVGIDPPDEIPRKGFIGEAPKYDARVGVWIMPDNQREGTLEQFLYTLIEDGEPLLPHARESTELAKQLNASFSENDKNKAVLHAWLAWQKTPGLPYGSAIRARYFRDDSSAALGFVNWFRETFQILVP